MWLSLNIIQTMVDISDITPEDLANRLTMATAEIDGIDRVNHFLKTIYTAKILDVKPHPGADKLTLVDLDTGRGNTRVVCGAPNHKKGDIVALATEGTRFNADFIIKKSKIRGEESCGMLCSEREMGFSDNHDGILIFSAGTEIGKSLADIYPGRIDTRLEIDNKSITHRPDLWSHLGFAREIGALLSRPVKIPVNETLKKDFVRTDDLSVSVKNPDACPRYTCLAIKNIRIEESPEWLKAAVSSIGMRPINNIVDITNYVMAETGEPMHAFDRRKLRCGEIIIRMASPGEKMNTLDGNERNLTAEDIVIADAGGAIALAGVMGGGNSEIDPATTEIVLEAANFNPVNIRKTAARFALRTEAAIRFEKSQSPLLTPMAILRCYELIKQVIPGAQAVTEMVDAYPVPQKDISITTSTDYIRERIGESLTDERITGILSSLGFGISINGKSMAVAVPYYRATKDISIPDDIVEEVGRIYGYDNISPMPPFVPCTIPYRNRKRQFERSVKTILSGDCRLTEVSAYSFVGEETLNRLKINGDKELRLKNPLSSEHDRLRRSLVPNLVRMIELNRRYQDEFAFYEIGRVYLKDDRKSSDLATENTRIAGAVFQKKPQGPMFYEMKLVVTTLFDRLRIRKYRLVPETQNLPPYAHPGRSARITIDGKDAGLIFELHPATIKEFELAGSAAMMDIDMDMLFQSPGQDLRFNELRKFPEVPFDISVLAGLRVYAEDILTLIRKTDGKLIHSAEVVSVYEGAPVPEGKKSVSVRIVLYSPEKTLESSDIESIQKKIIASLEKNGFPLR